jgi:hypothetical protein
MPKLLTDLLPGSTGSVNLGSSSLEFLNIYSQKVFVDDEAYGVAWDGSLEVPTKNAVYDKIESLAIPDNTDYVDLTTGQTITGQKTFSSQQNFSSIINMRDGFPQVEAIDIYPSTPPSTTTGAFVKLGSDGANRIFLNKHTSTVQAFLDFDGITVDRTYTFPNASGTFALTTDIPAGAGDNIYNSDGSLTGARTVTMAANELQWSGTGGIIYMNSGRLGVQTPVFGGSRLGDNEFQAKNIDTQSILFKNNAQATVGSLFMNPSFDTFTIKNFNGEDNFIEVTSNDIDDTNASRSGNLELGLTLNYTDTGINSIKLFNNDVGTTPGTIGDKMGILLQTDGTFQSAKEFWFGRFNGTSYSNIFSVSTADVVTFTNDVNVPDEAYGVSWDNSLEAPTKNAIYDKIESIDPAGNYLPLSGGTMTGAINSQSIIPTAGDTYDLGSDTNDFRFVYARDVDVKNGRYYQDYLDQANVWVGDTIVGSGDPAWAGQPGAWATVRLGVGAGQAWDGYSNLGGIAIGYKAGGVQNEGVAIGFKSQLLRQDGEASTTVGFMASMWGNDPTVTAMGYKAAQVANRVGVAVGFEAGRYAFSTTGQRTLLVGSAAGRYANGDDILIVGSASFGSNFINDTANAKTFSDGDYTRNAGAQTVTITITNHGFGSTSQRVVLRYTNNPITGTTGNFRNNILYTFVVEDANTLRYFNEDDENLWDIGLTPSTSHTLTPAVQYENIIVMGHNNASDVTQDNATYIGSSGITDAFIKGTHHIEDAVFIPTDTEPTATAGALYYDNSEARLKLYNGTSWEPLPLGGASGDYVSKTAGGTFDADISVPDEVYGAGWNGSLEVPTKNSVYDKIESLALGATTLNGLTDVTITAAATGEYLRFNGTAWVDSTIQAGDLPSHTHTKADITDFDDTDYVAVTGDTMTGDLVISSGNGEALKIVGGSTGASNTTWLSFYETGGTVRQGYVGFGSGGNTNLYILNDVSGTNLQLTGAGNLVFNDGVADRNVWHAGNDGAGSGLDADTLDGVSWGNVNTAIVTSETIQADEVISGVASTLDGGFTVHKADGAQMGIQWEDDFYRYRRGGGGTIAGWRWDNFDTELFSLDTSGNATLRNNFTLSTFGGERIKIIGNSTGDANTSTIGFYESNGTTRQGYIGFPTASNDDFYITADTGIVRISSGGGQVTFNGGSIAAEGVATIGTSHANSAPLRIEGTGDWSAATTAQCYMLGRDGTGDNMWYVGNASPAQNDLILYNYDGASFLAILDDGGGFAYNNGAERFSVSNSGTITTADEIVLDGGYRLRNSTDRPGLLQIGHDTTSFGWYGIQIQDDAGDLWSLMGNGGQFGLYDDGESEWILQYTQNAQVNLYHNGSMKFATSAAGITVTGTGTATDWILSSDERLKTDIKPLQKEAPKVEWKQFFMKNEDRQRYGVIAQEVEKTHPELVTTGEDGMKAVSYTDLLVLKMAEKDKEIESLQERVERLELLVEKLIK